MIKDYLTFMPMLKKNESSKINELFSDEILDINDI